MKLHWLLTALLLWMIGALRCHINHFFLSFFQFFCVLEVEQLRGKHNYSLIFHVHDWNSPVNVQSSELCQTFVLEHFCGGVLAGSLVHFLLFNNVMCDARQLQQSENTEKPLVAKVWGIFMKQFSSYTAGKHLRLLRRVQDKSIGLWLRMANSVKQDVWKLGSFRAAEHSDSQ